MANPFALDKKKGGAGPKKAYKATTYTEEEQKELLNGYVDLSEDLWPLVRYGTHMRYITKDGNFRIGGFVTRNPLDTIPRGGKDKKRFVRLQNGFDKKNPGYAEWVVAYEDVKSWYCKPDASAMAVQNTLRRVTAAFNANLQKLADSTRAMEKRIAELERRR
jgi:hypothetical protein